MSEKTKSTNKKSPRVFGHTVAVTATVYEKASKQKHRNKIPVFMQNYQRKDYPYSTWYLLKLCEKHDFNLNPYLNALRLAKGEKETIRLERREMLSVLCPTLIAYCNLSPVAEHLFEVQASVEHLAKMCNQNYESWDNKTGKHRTRCDTVRNALDMLEEAELITVLRQYDKKGRKYKPMRIWLNIEFFLMFGITEHKLRTLVVNYHKYQFINNQLGRTFKAYQKHLDKLETKGVADIKSNYALNNLLIKRRKAFLGEKIIKFVSQRKPSNYLSLDIESDVFKPCFRSFNDCNSPEEVWKLKKRLFDRERLRAQARQKSAEAIIFRQALTQSYINDLRFV